MVNLRGAAAGFGRALSQIGQLGMEAQQQAERDQRLLDRERALSRFRHELNEEAADTASERSLNQSAQRDKQLLDRRRQELEIEEPYKERENERTVSREVARESRANSEWDRRTEREYRRWLQQESTREDNWRSRQQWMRENGFYRGDNPRLVRNGETGTYWEYSPDGTMSDTGMQFPQSSSSGDDIDDRIGRMIGGMGPAIAAEGRRTLSTNRQPQRSNSSPNTYTEDDVRETMRANRWDRARAIREIEARGFRRAE